MTIPPDSKPYHALLNITPASRLEDIFPKVEAPNLLQRTFGLVSSSQMTLDVKETLDDWIFSLVEDMSGLSFDKIRLQRIAQIANQILKNNSPLILQDLLKDSSYQTKKVIYRIEFLTRRLFEIQTMHELLNPLSYLTAPLAFGPSLQLPCMGSNLSFQFSDVFHRRQERHSEENLKRLSRHTDERSTAQLCEVFHSVHNQDILTSTLLQLSCEQHHAILMSTEEPNRLATLLSSLPVDSFVLLLKLLSKDSATKLNKKLHLLESDPLYKLIPKLHEILTKLTSIANNSSKVKIDKLASDLRGSNPFRDLGTYLRPIQTRASKINLQATAVQRFYDLTLGLISSLIYRRLLDDLIKEYKTLELRCSLEGTKLVTGSLYAIYFDLIEEREKQGDVDDDEPADEVFYRAWSLSDISELVKIGLINEGESWKEVIVALKKIGIYLAKDLKEKKIFCLEELKAYMESKTP